MKNLAIITITWIFILLAGCGGGGDSFSATETVRTPMRTPVDITAIKPIYTGTATSGTQTSFALTGADLKGNSWTGSYTLISDGSTTLDGQTVTSSHSILALQKIGGDPTILVTTRYFLASIGVIYKIVDSSGKLSSSLGGVPLSDVALIGEGATVAGYYSDGTTAFIGWMLDPDLNGNSKLTFSTVTHAADHSIISLEDDSFYLDPLGSIYKMTVVVTTDGTTVTLSGNKN